MTKNYWAYRIDNSNTSFFNSELQEGRLRQGWGYDEGQNLRTLSVNNGARRNLPMFKKVKKGDVILIPHISGYNQLTLATATDDWDLGYRFEIDPSVKDYGHIFPAKPERIIFKYHNGVSANLRRSLKNPLRFWSLTPYGADIEHILELSETELNSFQPKNTMETITHTIFNNLFSTNEFKKSLYNNCIQKFQSAEWENLLVDALRALFPAYQIDHVGGQKEQLHGTDIKITIPGLFGQSYVIAIQVKDYEGVVSPDIITQINKADSAFSDETTKVIEKIVLVTRADKNQNKDLMNRSDVKFIFLDELQELLTEAGKKLIGINLK